MLPNSLRELFDNKDEVYHYSHEDELNNNEAMEEFLDLLGVKSPDILLDDGTLVFLRCDGKLEHISISCIGGGDFFNHIYEIERHDLESYKRQIGENDNHLKFYKDLKEDELNEEILVDFFRSLYEA